MATGEESNVSYRCIEDCGDVRQIRTEVTTPSSLSVPFTVPMFTLSSSTAILSSCTTTLANKSCLPMSTSPMQSELSLPNTTIKTSNKHHTATSPVKSSSSTKQAVQSLLVKDGRSTKSSAAIDSLTHKLKKSSAGNNEPLNLSVNSKPDEKQITSSLFGVIPEPGSIQPGSEAVTASRTAAAQTSSTYKAAHPIGSRKVTENVITYHEPMFQSVANNLFENQKNLMMGKRKNDEERLKGESCTSDSKKRKLEPCTSASHSKSPSTSPIKNVKKKCSIENIIERIRTEKTVSRSSSITTPSGNLEVDCENVESCDKTASDSLNSDTEKVSSTTSSKEVQKSHVSTNSSETSIVSSTSNSPDIHKVTSTTSTPELESDGCNSNDTVKIDGNKVVESKEIGENKSVDKISDEQFMNSNDKNSMDCATSIKKKHNKISSKSTEGKVVKQKQKCDKTDSKVKKALELKKGKSKDKSLTDGDEKISEKKTKKKQLFASTVKGVKICAKEKQRIKSDTESQMKKESKKSLFEKDYEKKKKNATKKDKNVAEKKKKVKKKNEDDSDESSDGQEETKKEVKKLNVVKKKKTETTVKNTKQRKPKMSIACRRVKREASLNAAMFLNILNESPRSLKLESQRSKSDSDLKNIQSCGIRSSHSMSNVTLNKSNNDTVDKNKIDCVLDGQKLELKLEKTEIPESFATPKKESKQLTKTPSPKRRVSFSDDVFDSVFDAVIQRSIDETGKNKPKLKSEKSQTVVKKLVKDTEKGSKKMKDDKAKEMVRKQTGAGKTDKKEKTIRLQKIKKAVKLTITTSPEEIAEKKRKANLARLERAKEFRKTERKVSERILSEEKNSDDSMSDSSEKNDDETRDQDQTESESKEEEIKKMKTKKGALFRAARTHVLVESKTVVENTMPSPRWCECCQSSYYPSQPTQGAQVWRIKQLVDKDSTKSPEPIQSSSNHFIAAHASCEVRPYASPSHVSVIDSAPYVGQIVQHGHIPCSPCSCGHSGVFHHGQCQNCTLGGVSNILPCQRYSNTYSVTYPHTHGSYTHCGCGACYPAGSYHHSVGQTLIHQPQMPMTTESPILLHHPVQLQVTHDTSHSVSMATMPHSHNESSLSHSLQSVPLPLGHGEQNLSNLTHMCQLSQGEVTNVSVMGSSSPSDHEIVDVGSRDDIIKLVPSSSQITTESFYSANVDAKSKKAENKGPLVGKKKTKNNESEKGAKISDKKIGDKISKKNDKKSKLLLIKQKQKQLELKSLKFLQKKEAKNSSNTAKINKKQVKERSKSMDTKVVKKDKLKKSLSCEPALDDSLNKEQSKRAWHGWSWDGDGTMKKIINIFDGQSVQRKCYNGIKHEDGDTIQVKDCVLVCSGRKEKDIPYVAKVSNFWEDSTNGEMMMSVLWFYRPEHAEGGRIYGNLENEVFAAKHRDETLVACIEDRGYVLTYNEYCRFMAEVQRTKHNLPMRKKVVPDPEESYPSSRIPPVDINPENVFLCRQVYDIKLKRVLKNPS